MQRVPIGSPAINEVRAVEAKPNFSKLLVRANQDEEITITHRGQPFA